MLSSFRLIRSMLGSPVAMIVTQISSSILGSVTIPKMMLASGSTDSAMTPAAFWTSLSVILAPPVMLRSTPRAPSMLTSSIGLLMALLAASTARSAPCAEPMDIHAGPAPVIIVLMSAKSRLISPGTVTSSAMDLTPSRSTSSASLKASSAERLSSHIAPSRSLGTTISVSTLSLRRARPSSAFLPRRLPSKLKGLVTTAMVSAPVSRATSATTGAAPVPVPPPMPPAMKSISAPRTDS